MTDQDEQLLAAPYLALTHLVVALEHIADKYPELYDTHLRETMAQVLTQGFVHGNLELDLPESFGMYTQEADARVKHAFDTFFKELAATPESWHALDHTERLLILGGDTVRTSRGQALPDFIGFYINPSRVVGN